MGRLLGVAFAILMAIELVVLVLGIGLMARFIQVAWSRNPFIAGALILIVAVTTIALWRAGRSPDAAAPVVHPGISISRIPFTGGVGALYMLQFLVWAVVEPAVGVFYAALIAGGVLLLPLALYVNRRHQAAVTAMNTGALLGLLCGLAFFAVLSTRQVPLAIFFIIAMAAGLISGAVLVRHRSRSRHTSIAPYGK